MNACTETEMRAWQRRNLWKFLSLSFDLALEDIVWRSILGERSPVWKIKIDPFLFLVEKKNEQFQWTRNMFQLGNLPKVAEQRRSTYD